MIEFIICATPVIKWLFQREAERPLVLAYITWNGQGVRSLDKIVIKRLLQRYQFISLKRPSITAANYTAERKWKTVHCFAAVAQANNRAASLRRDTEYQPRFG
ncbi:hypothetical protein ROA7450_03005 [Roseovarius albus]|uniref:Uncharacterized protein n=1 Tax=Roseovarius albus TaxID=1247867 RepID=A0A1X6ZQC9_9RHOB|nr:hypothetical protein ROA7450_03005 [Roseovarius albus]